jgi:hypothetical protein
MFDLSFTQRNCLRALLDLLAQGERLAADCAAEQAKLCGGSLSRFFHAQSRQERMHAWIFDAGLARLGGSQGGVPPALRSYRARVEADLAAGNLAASVTATQVVLEALGHAVLTELALGLERSRPAFAGLCRVLLRQEQAHHAFGIGFVTRAGDATTLSAAGTEYAALARALIDVNAYLLDGLNVEPGAFRAAFERALPAALHAPAT